MYKQQVTHIYKEHADSAHTDSHLQSCGVVGHFAELSQSWQHAAPGAPLTFSAVRVELPPQHSPLINHGSRAAIGLQLPGQAVAALDALIWCTCCFICAAAGARQPVACMHAVQRVGCLPCHAHKMRLSRHTWKVALRTRKNRILRTWYDAAQVSLLPQKHACCQEFDTIDYSLGSYPVSLCTA